MLFNIEFLSVIITIIYIYLFFIRNYWFIFVFFVIYFITKVLNISLNTSKFNFNTYYYILNSLLETKIFLIYTILSLFILFLLKKISANFINNFILICFFYYLLSLGLFKYKICLYKHILVASILLNNDFTSELLNGLFFLHPIFFFLTTLYIYLLVLIKFYKIFNFFLKNNIFYVKFNIIIFIGLIIFLSIISGAWWAQQELNWNGWWSWDNIELINFLELLIIIIIIHQINYFNKNMIKLNLLVLFFFIVLISLRFNLIITRHTFLINLNELQFSIYGVLIIISIFYLICSIKNIINFNDNIKFKENNNFNLIKCKFSFIFLKKSNLNYFIFLYNYIVIYFFINFIAHFKYIYYIIYYLFNLIFYINLYINLLIIFYLNSLNLKHILILIKNKSIIYKNFLFLFTINLLNFFKLFKLFEKTTILYKHWYYYIFVFHIFLFQLILSLILMRLISFIYTPLFLLDFLLYSELTINNIISNFKLTNYYINLNFKKKINFNTLNYFSKNNFNIIFLNQDITFLQYNNNLIGLFNHSQKYKSTYNNVIILLHSTGLNTIFKDLWLLFIKITLLFILYFILFIYFW